MTQPLFAPSPSRSRASPDAPAEGDVARVALPVPLDALFDYRVPRPLARAARPGCRVQVRFHGRPLTGIVVERSERSEFPGRLALLERVVDEEPVLTPDLLDWIREAAEEVLCPIGVALSAAVPPGSAPRRSRGFGITRLGREALARGALPEPARGLLGSAAEHPVPALRLQRRAAERPGGAALLRALLRDGLLEPCTIERSAARVARRRTAALRPGVDVEAACRESLARAPKQAQLLRLLAERGELPTRELPGAGPQLRALQRRELIDLHEREVASDVLGAALEPPVKVELSDAQARALEPIAGAVRERSAQTFLLHGVTGSGKTEVYLRAIDAALGTGRQALVLVPEITLTHQILARLRGRFGDAPLAVLHSALRPGERIEQWQRLRRGAARVAVGARSALFAPLDDLGLIVVDEEHDSAYKDEGSFRYHARRLAELRAARARCPLVLGSATPSLESRYAADQGRLRRIVLPHRIAGRPLPAVTIVDLERERAQLPRGRKIVLSSPLLRAMDDALGAGGQVILFLNRRGFSTQILCFECGHAERCVHCDISLVFHTADHSLRCHYCDYRMPPPERCRGCGAPDTALLGLGTERLEEEVRAAFEGARIARLDRDTAARRGYAESVLRDLRHGRLDVVIGTQMLAKGHDFPGVRLVGVVLADVGLHLPDFRAAERTLQLLTQVAGRAGRDSVPGRVLIQTFSPDHYAIAPVAEHDYESFYAREIRERRSLGYPPCGRLTQVVVSAASLEAAEGAARGLAEGVVAAGRAGAGTGVELLGPAPCPLSRLRDRHRFQLLAKGGEAGAVRRAAQVLLGLCGELPSGVTATLDTDPLDML